MQPASVVNPFQVIKDGAPRYLSIRKAASLVDMHVEATSEKQAMGYHLEGKLQAWWSEPKNTHAHGQQTYELRFRALLAEGCSELELFGLKERGAVRNAPLAIEQLTRNEQVSGSSQIVGSLFLLVCR